MCYSIDAWSIARLGSWRDEIVSGVNPNKSFIGLGPVYTTEIEFSLFSIFFFGKIRNKQICIFQDMGNYVLFCFQKLNCDFAFCDW